MPNPRKQLGPSNLNWVTHPQNDSGYMHFENAAAHPFDPTPGTFSKINAWWLAEASLLCYWKPNDVASIFKQQAQLDSRGFDDKDNKDQKGTQGFIAWSKDFAIVAFRGTEPDSLLDIVTDLKAKHVPWLFGGETVHEGFMEALDTVWSNIVKIESIQKLPVWFTGHSLGAALATLAADRFVKEQTKATLGGVYTYGSPLVGNRAFVDGFNLRHHGRSFRYVNDKDGVTQVPPEMLGFRHVNDERYVGEDDKDVWFKEPLIDHMPRRYAILTWNAF